VPKPTRAVIYRRLSQTSETSVSIARQREECEAEALRLGLDVVLVATDDGVSGSKTAPLDRRGFREIRDLDQPWDVLIVWSLDRLVRNIAAFHETHAWLKEQGKALVLVKEKIDGSTTVGEMVLGLLSGIAQIEAENIAARVTAARHHLLTTGRSAGGATPYGWRNVDNPAGPGKVLARHPERVEVVRRIVAEAQRGDSMYGIAKGLTEDGVPAPSWRGVPFAWREWHHGQVERTLRHPVLAGMVSHNPGAGGQTRTRGDDVVRDASGLPVVRDDLAVMPVEDWRALVGALDGRESPQARPRAMKSRTSALLSGLLWCHDGRHPEPQRMWRGTVQGREGYVCRAKGCHMVITNFEDALVEHVLARVGDDLRWQRVRRVATGGEAELPEIERRLDELSALVRAAADRDERARLREQEDALIDLRDAKRAEGGAVEWVQVATDRTFREDYEAAATVDERRAVLDDCVERVEVRRGRPGRRVAGQVLERLTVVLKPTPEWHQPDETWLGESA
jgi:site-specific DNA recombinase